jgi:glycosyltransferase involved in cell wall biosynthesis
VRIAIITTSYPSAPGDAAGHFVATEARTLANDGHEVYVLSPFARAAHEHGVRHVQVKGGTLFGWPGALEKLKGAPWLLPQALKFTSSVRSELSKLGPFDKVFAHWIVPSAFPAALGQRQLAVIAHGSDVRLLAKLPKPVSRQILKTLVAQGASFQCVSKALRDELTTLYPPLRPHCSVRPAALDLSDAPTRPAARARLGLRQERVLLSVGRIIEQKRVETAIRAASLMPNTKLVVIGAGPELDQLGQQFGDVTFLGQKSRTETLTWIAAADVLLSASRLEGAPTAVREAVALGVDVVAYPCGDLSEWAKSEELLHLVQTRP